MGFSSLDDYVNKTTVDSKFMRVDWQKLAAAVGAQTAGEWHCLFANQGNPTAGVFAGAGTNLSFQSCCEESTGAIRHGGVVTPETKHLSNASAFSAAATSCPAVLLLVDILGFYPMSTTTTSGDQATIHAITATFANATDLMTHTGYDIASFTRVRFTTSGTLPAELVVGTDYWTVRQSASTSKLATSYANAVAGTTIDLSTDGTPTTTVTTYIPRYTDGKGVRCVAVTSAACGAATPSLRITYTDTSGNTGNLTPGTLPVGKTSAGIAMVPYSGTGAGKYGPDMPLAAGDLGIVSIQQLNLSVSYVSGQVAWLLIKILAEIPLTTIGVPGERDFFNQFPSLPRIQDGACLAWLMYAGAATPVNTAYFGHLDIAWG